MAESFMRTLKHEEVDGRAYRDLAEAQTRIEAFIEEIYNRQRLHSALRYRPPAVFEDDQSPLDLPHAAGPVEAVATIRV